MIIWGTKRVVKKLGYAADFCPLCRDVRTFKVHRVGMAGHVYYLSFGQGELAGFTRTCTVCGTEMPATPDQYASISKEALPPEQLVPITFPTLATAHKERLAVEKALRSSFSQVSAADRRALLREPFILLSPRVEARFASIHLDWPTGLTLLVAVLALIFVPGPVSAALPEYASEIIFACIAAAVIAVGVQVYLSSERFMRKQVLPILAPALRPLKPTREELEQVLKDMKALGRRIGRKLKLASLLEVLQGEATAGR